LHTVISGAVGIDRPAQLPGPIGFHADADGGPSNATTRCEQLRAELSYKCDDRYRG
jgi:hypothetical protein